MVGQCSGKAEKCGRRWLLVVWLPPVWRQRDDKDDFWGVVHSLLGTSHVCWESEYTRLQQPSSAQPKRPTRRGEVDCQGSSRLAGQMGLFVGFSSVGNGTHWCCELHPAGKPLP